MVFGQDDEIVSKAPGGWGNDDEVVSSGPEAIKEKKKTNWKQDAKIGLAQVGNTVDKAWSGLSGLLADTFEGEEAAANIYKNMQGRVAERNQYAALPEDTEQSLMGKATSLGLTLPSQVLTAPLSAFSTGQDMIDNGETLNKARLGTGIDTVGNMVGFALPGGFGGTVVKKALTGAASNAAQDAAVRLGIGAIADQDKTKQDFAPTADTTILAGALGAGMGAVTPKKATKAVAPTVKLPDAAVEAPKGKQTTVDDIPQAVRDQQSFFNAADEVVVPAQRVADEGQLELPFTNSIDDSPVPRSPQADMFDQGSVREMESARALQEQQVLQARVMQEQQAETARAEQARQIEQAYVQKAQEGVVDPVARQQEMDLAFRQREADLRNEAAEAKKTQQDDMLSRLEEKLNNTPRVRRGPASQRGRVTIAEPKKSLADRGITIRETADGFEALQDGVRVGYLNDNLKRGQAEQINENANIDIVKVSKEVKGTGVGRALYEAFHEKHGGRVAPSGKTTADAWKVWKSAYPEKVEQFVKQEAARVADGADPQLVLGNITDPSIAQRVMLQAQDRMPRRGPANQRGMINLGRSTPRFDNDGQTKINLKDGRIVTLDLEDAGGGAQFIRAYHEGQKIGELFVSTKRRPDGGYFHPDVSVEPEFQRLGLGTALYDAAESIGATIPPLDETGAYRTSAGQAFRAARRGPAGQRGGINRDVFTGVAEGLSKMFKGEATKASPKLVQDIVGKSHIPVDPIPAEVVSKALTEGSKYDLSGGLTEAGSTLAAMTRRSALVQGVSRLFQNAEKRADLYIKNVVNPVERQFRHLDNQAVVNLHKVFMWELDNRRTMSAEELQASGMDIKQLKAYAGMREMFHNSLDAVNRSREGLGLEAITEKEHYMSSRWQGDFRQPVYKTKLDKDGNPKILEDGSFAKELVWYLAADSKWGMDKQVKALQQAHPELLIDPKLSHKVRTLPTGKTEFQSLYTRANDILGRDNAVTQALKEEYEASMMQDAYGAFGQAKHFKDKHYIRGFVGDRPGHGGPKEARAMFSQQMAHSKNAFKWSSLQEAQTKAKEIVTNPELREMQPKNTAYVENYIAEQLGHGTAQWVKAGEDAIRSLGILSPSAIGRGVGAGKSYFIVSKLAVNTGFAIAQAVQVMNTIPHLVDTMVKHGGNPLKALSYGLLSGVYLGADHYSSKVGMDLPGNKFFNEARAYAEDNAVTSRSSMDEASIESRGPVSAVANALGHTISAPDTFSRSMAFMTFAQMLKDSGKFKNNMELFQKAEELTNASMVDQRAGERALAFGKLGTAGNAISTLQNFPINMLNQYRYFLKEAVRGNPAPLVSMMVMQYLMAGAAGIPGFNDLDKMLGWMKGHLPTEMWEKVKDFDPKLWMIENLGESSVYGALSTKTGVNLTTRLAAPQIGDMAAAPGAPLLDILKQAGSVAQAAVDPENSTKRAQAIHDVAPTGLQGYLETGPFKDENAMPPRDDGTTLYKKASKLEERVGQYARTPMEERIRSFGLRSQREAFHNDIDYKARQAVTETNKRSESLVESFYSALRRGDEKKANELQTLYVKLNGKAIETAGVEAQVKQEAMTALEKRSESMGDKLETIKQVALMRKMLEKRDGR